MSKRFRRFNFLSLLITCAFGLTMLLNAEDAPRKVKSKVAPQYPDLAKKMNVSGAVKLELIVAANGQVKSVRPLGGHPLLIDAAQNAVKQWRYEPGSEGTEVVEIRFSNNN